MSVSAAEAAGPLFLLLPPHAVRRPLCFKSFDFSVVSFGHLLLLMFFIYLQTTCKDAFPKCICIRQEW